MATRNNNSAKSISNEFLEHPIMQMRPPLWCLFNVIFVSFSCHFRNSLRILCVSDGYHVDIGVEVNLTSFSCHFRVIFVSFSRFFRDSLCFRWISCRYWSGGHFGVILMSFSCHFLEILLSIVFSDNLSWISMKLCKWGGFAVLICITMALRGN